MLVKEKDYEQAKREINSHEEVVCDTETTGLQWAKGDKVCGVSILAGDKSYYFPFRHGEGGNLPEQNLQDLCKTVLRPDRPHLGFNYKFDILMLQKEGMTIPNKIGDSQLSAHLLNENEESFKMESLMEKYIDENAGKEEKKLIDKIVERFGGGRSGAKEKMWKLPASEVAPYAEQDVISTRALRDLHKEPLKEWENDHIYEELCDYSLAIAEMTLNGLQLDIDLIQQYTGEAKKHTNNCLKRAAEMAGYEINLNSSKQCQAWLGVKSTSREHLAPMVERGDERAKTLQEFRVWSKVEGTYYRPFLKFCDENGVLHPDLNLTGTIIRLSCKKPNLQAVPRGTNVYKVKNVFVARPGYTFVEADLSQAEVRVMAHYTRDQKLIEILKTGVNMHDKVSQEQDLPRDVAKRLNFSAQYGIGAKKFSETYGYTIHESRAYLEKYHAMFPGIKRFYHVAEAKAGTQGFVRLYTGRVQHFKGWKSPTHKASSRIIQGAVAEMIRIAMTRLRKEVPEAKQLLQVHDSLNFEVPIGGKQEICRKIKQVMEDQPWCSIPIFVDIKEGPSWGEAKEIVWEN